MTIVMFYHSVNLMFLSIHLLTGAFFLCNCHLYSLLVYVCFIYICCVLLIKLNDDDDDDDDTMSSKNSHTN